SGTGGSEVMGNLTTATVLLLSQSAAASSAAVADFSSSRMSTRPPPDSMQGHDAPPTARSRQLHTLHPLLPIRTRRHILRQVKRIVRKPIPDKYQSRTQQATVEVFHRAPQLGEDGG